MPQDTAIENVTPELPIRTGYLDKTLKIFDRHTYPFVLIGTMALTCSGANSLPRDEIDSLTVTETRQGNGNAPEIHIQHFVRYLYLDWASNREWILSTKISDINRSFMRSTIENFQRKQLILWDPVLEKSVFDKMPWELSIKGQAT
ncbi:MAG: hypothetical protein Q9188_007309 [Gyalolechia gomerana]